MKKLMLSLFAAGLAVMPLAAKEKLNVLYVGGSANIYTSAGMNIDSAVLEASIKERTANFTKFLKKHFTKVTAVNGKDYDPNMSKNFDVTVFDGRPNVYRKGIREKGPDGNYIKYERDAYLPDDFSSAAVCIAQASEEIGRSLGNKNDWYCLCLDNYAYRWNKEHPIFNGPFKVDIKSEMRPTPEPAVESGKYFGYTAPAELEMWMISPRSYQEKLPDGGSIRVGMVSRPWGYKDSPDAEVISGGVSAKCIDAISIGRHGNMFHWGFAADPAELTESAQAALANAIVYMAQFNGKPMIARKVNDRVFTREMLSSIRYNVTRQAVADADEYNRMNYELQKQNIAEFKAKQERGEKLSEIEKMQLNYASSLKKPEPQSYDRYIKEREPKLYEVFGADEQAYQDYYEKNAPYFYADVNSLMTSHLPILDKEARELGIANNDIRIIDKAIELMEQGKPEGKILLDRYTLKRFSTPAEYRAWFNKNRDNMFFTESGGWKWLVNTYEPGENDYSVLKKQ